MPSNLRNRIRQLIRPPLSAGSPDYEMAAGLSIALAAAVSALLVALVVGVPFLFARKAAATLMISIGLCGSGMSAYAARRGRVRLGVWILLAQSWISVTTVTWLAGGLATVYPIFYVVLAAAAGWLLGRRAVMLHSAMSFAAVFIMVVVDTAGPGLTHYFPMRPFPALLVFGWPWPW